MAPIMQKEWRKYKISDSDEYTVMHSRVKDPYGTGSSLLFGLTETEADMCLELLNEHEGTPLGEKLFNRILWADRQHSGINRLINFSLVHGGRTMVSDPLLLKIVDGKIVSDA